MCVYINYIVDTKIIVEYAIIEFFITIHRENKFNENHRFVKNYHTDS